MSLRLRLTAAIILLVAFTLLMVWTFASGRIFTASWYCAIAPSQSPRRHAIRPSPARANAGRLIPDDSADSYARVAASKSPRCSSTIASLSQV